MPSVLIGWFVALFFFLGKVLWATRLGSGDGAYLCCRPPDVLNYLFYFLFYFLYFLFFKGFIYLSAREHEHKPWQGAGGTARYKT